MKKKPEKQLRERIIRNKDIEALGLDSAKMQVNMCKDKPDKRMDAGKRVLAGLSECIFAIWW